MSSRRSRRNRSAHKSRHPVPAQFELLEQRRLLTTLYGGQSLVYKDANDNNIMIVMGGRIQAEFTFAHLHEDTNPIYPRLGHHVPAFLEDAIGADLFNIYVHYAEEDSYIAIAEIDENGQMIPFSGDIGSLNINGAAVSAPGETGTVYLGARTLDIEGTEIDESDRPILAGHIAPGGQGLLPPQPGNLLRAGITVANGHSLGAFLLGGTFTGFANFSGSIGDFYAGWLLAGDARGQSGGPPAFRDNFFVNGDARNILSLGSIGTDGGIDEEGSFFQTGFDLQVRGALGQLRSGGTIAGSVDVVNALGGPFFNRVQREVEMKSGSPGFAFASGRLTGAPILDNDTFDTPQYLGSLNDSFFGGQKGIRLTGSIDGGDADYYGVALLAGQVVTVQVTDGQGSGPGVGVFDPDGRLIMTDFNDMDSSATLGQQFQFRADRPGVYRFAVGSYLPEGGGGFGGVSPYSLRISGVGDIGIGGVVAGNDIRAGSEQAVVTLRRGDFGVLSGSSISSGDSDTLHVMYGAGRAILATDSIIGLELNIPYGNVGLIQTQSADGILYISNNNVRMIGGSYQVIDAAGTLQAGSAPLMTQTYAQRLEARGLIARGGIGVIRAGNMATAAPSYIEVNADANLDPRFGPVTDGGRDGIIDLIDVEGDIGTLAAGGPAIVTNFGGNVRYMTAGGEVYGDRYFSSGPIGTSTLLNKDLVLVDDGGGYINISGARKRNPRFGLLDEDGNPEPEFMGKAPAVTYRAYPIRGSGGSVLMDITSDRRLEITNIATNAAGTMATPVEIGRITMSTDAEAQLAPGIDPLTGLETTLWVWTPVPGGLPMDLILRGQAPIDVLHVEAGIIDVISNVTGGEIGTVTASQINNLFASEIGITRSRTGTAVEPRTELLTGFPFDGQRLGVVAEALGNVAASGAIGAVSSAGTINAIIANQDRVDFSPAEFEGIVGPIFSGGEIGYVDIGEGLASSGNSSSPQGGIYATGQIRYVTNNNGHGSIWGNIVSNTRINQIVLNNGAIINANIMVVEDLAMSDEFTSELILTETVDNSDSPIYEIGNVEINGTGGVIGTVFAAADFGNLTVNDGFGLLNSVIIVANDGNANRINVDGYGIRGATIGDGGSVTEVNARGNGAPVNVLAFTRDVRGSALRGNGFDPRTGFQANRLTDLYKVFNVTPANPHRDNHTNSGIIENVLLLGNRNLGEVYANRIRNSIFNFANRIDRIQTRSAINNLSLTTGELVHFQAGSTVLNFEGTVAGPVGTFIVQGDYADSSSLIATGPSGRIGTFRVQRDLAGNVGTTGVLNTLIVGRDVTATGHVQADSILVQQIGGDVLGTITVF